jgi:small-conductance mechanosensitive channel
VKRALILGLLLALSACTQPVSQFARPPQGAAAVSTETIVRVAAGGRVDVHLRGATLREALERVSARAGLSVKVESDVPKVGLFVSFSADNGEDALRALARLGGVTLEREKSAGLVVHRVGNAPRDLFEHGPYHLFLGALLLFSAWLGLRAFNAFLARRERASRQGAKRLKRLGPLIRAVTWVVAVVSALLVMLRVSPTTAFAVTGGGLLILGIASRELTANLLAGLTIAIDRPLHVGDFVTVGGYSGEVVSVGLRSTRLVTPDDTMITIPNALIATTSVASANYGEVDALVEITFHVAHEADVAQVRALAWEGLVTSAYCAWRKPARVFVSEGPRSTRVVAAAYVFDVRHQRRFVTDVTHRVKAAFAAAQVPYPKEVLGPR